MCGLFGFSDPSRSLTPRQARQLLRALSVSSMVRGTDATGIAYNSHDRLHIYKTPGRSQQDTAFAVCLFSRGHGPCADDHARECAIQL